MIKKTKSRALRFKDFESRWYGYWSHLLKQDTGNNGKFKPLSNKFWQNAAICQVLKENDVLKKNSKGIGFGVGNERLPALFANLGISVTASDQDFKTPKAKLWQDGELAKNIDSLNIFNISTKDKIMRHVDFKQIDMTKIPKNTFNKYDFVWSNCSLGHLGSVGAGMNFIEDSLNCLKPGGVAVHTTEVNILSDTKTLKSGDTVIFRLKDLYQLFTKLTKQGYVCKPLDFNLGDTSQDFRITMLPKFGNDFSKIQIGNHLATQVILIIKKPKIKFNNQKSELLKHKISYRKNLKLVNKHRSANHNLMELEKLMNIERTPYKIEPTLKTINFKLKTNSTKEVSISFKNQSNYNIYKIDGRLNHIQPVMLGTSNPFDRKSLFNDTSWFGTSKNRPSIRFSLTSNGPETDEGYIKAKAKFFINFTINSKDIKPGKYEENFCLVHEGIEWIQNSEFKIKITVS